MERFWSFIDTMKLGVWLVLIFLFHMLLYLALRTDTWFLTALMATATYGAAFVLLKAIGKRRRQKI
ncbi:hypothetical protein [Effusibacillus consociatus]|uniref:Uncharacterized protein n=1 Tax=Effusibacillus consociatus TaxID=1117041 RepID=A0ABV9PZW8_9BACL